MNEIIPYLVGGTLIAVWLICLAVILGFLVAAIFTALKITIPIMRKSVRKDDEN